jgi:hypothetical protein
VSAASVKLPLGFLDLSWTHLWLVDSESDNNNLINAMQSLASTVLQAGEALSSSMGTMRGTMGEVERKLEVLLEAHRKLYSQQEAADHKHSAVAVQVAAVAPNTGGNKGCWNCATIAAGALFWAE